MTNLVRQEIVTAARTVVIKIGTRPLTRADGLLDESRVARLAGEIHELCASGRKVALVSSGAVGAGMGQLGLKARPGDVPHLQAVAAIGQCYMMQAYDRALRAHGRHAAQILLTAEDLEDRPRYLNVRNTISTLLEMGAVPIINENDTVSVEELRTTFGDNDRLAALVTNLLRAPLLIILSDVAGLYDGDPSLPGAKLIPTVTRLDDSIMAMVQDRSGVLSKGGMYSKLQAARIATAAGENVIIASGIEPNMLSRIFQGEEVGTLFIAQGATVAARKRWFGFSVQPRGYLVLDAGACRAVAIQGRSLLPAGIAGADGGFAKGDVVSLRDAEGREIARGLTNYSLADVLRIKGLKTQQIAGVLGECLYPEVIHRDNLLVTALPDDSLAQSPGGP